MDIYAKVSYKLIANGNIKSEDREIYEYGLRQGAITLINLVTTVLVGALFHMLLYTLIYMICYIPIRMYVGGYHTNSQLRCYLFSIGLNTSVLILIRNLVLEKEVIIFLLFIAGATICLLAPIEDYNKLLAKDEVIVYRKKARRLVIVTMSISVILIALGYITQAKCIIISLLALSVMLIMGAIKNGLIKIKAIEEY